MSNKKNKKIKSSKYENDTVIRRVSKISNDDSLDSDDDNTIARLKNARLNSSDVKSDTLEESDNTGSTENNSDDTSSSSSSNEEPIKEETPQKKFIKKNSNEIFKELIKHQLPDVPFQWKLNINDMKRICKYIDTSIFDKNTCCIWNGYITNMNNSNKGTYVNFYFRNKKVALHRLLYSNFMAPLDSSEYLKFNCINKGICCNVYHYEKYKYSKNYNMTKKEPRPKETKKEIKDISIVGTDDSSKLIIDFD